MSRLSLLVAVVATLLLTRAAYADYVPTHQDSICNVGETDKKWAVPGPINVVFNPSLDPLLDGAANDPFVVGHAGTRNLTFVQAIAAWNAALTKVGATLRLAADTTCQGGPDFCKDQWATDQTPMLCVERDSTNEQTGYLVFDRDYTNHNNDSKQVVSTGHNHNNNNKDQDCLPIGPGWIAHSDQPAPPSVGPIDMELLGETSPRDDGVDIVEADIAWFTHFENTLPACARIRWDYTAPNVACGKDKLPGKHYDFYSVIVHELGHLLGLNHMQHGDPDCHNVMFGTLEIGERQIITSKEEACLRELYGPVTGVGSIGSKLPAKLALGVNPIMGGLTSMVLHLPAGEEVQVTVYDVAGQQVRVIWNGRMEPGKNPLEWDGTRQAGIRAAPGLYFARAIGLRSGFVTQSRFTLLR